jgi:Carboxypeptidase regulatory-like domain
VVRETICHRTRRPGACWALAVLAVLLSLGACRRTVPIYDASPRPVEADGTISGTVRGPEGTSPVEGRQVEIINISTGERHRAVTSNTGGFTLKLPPGRYRVELALLNGETLVKRPGVITLDRSDVDAHADFVIGSSRVARPRPRPPAAADHGLGSPIA